MDCQKGGVLLSDTRAVSAARITEAGNPDAISLFWMRLVGDESARFLLREARGILYAPNTVTGQDGGTESGVK